MFKELCSQFVMMQLFPSVGNLTELNLFGKLRDAGDFEEFSI